MITMVDLGDTSRSLGPIVMVPTQPEQLLREDPSDTPMINLKKVSQFRESSS